MRCGSWIITHEGIAMAENEFAPFTPGEMLKEEFLAEYELSQNQPPRRLAFRRTGLQRL
jgi:plasmid maintenance system antidote protein VapI